MLRNKRITALGLMSGTSLDGLDLCLADFYFNNGKWSYKILKAQTVAYKKSFRQELKTAPEMSALELAFLSNRFAKYCALQINLFLKDVSKKPDIIASHGQTIFHQPQKNLTVQIGNGAIIAALTGITTVCDFRTTDVALNGQGAPLVPVGDKYLFSDFDACLNLGGFANITLNTKKNFLAFDICPVNIVLNPLAEQLGKPYDNDGIIAKSAQPNSKLLSILNKLSFYKKPAPKSLGKEWVDKFIIPKLEQRSFSVEEKISTLTEHAAMQISAAINKHHCKRVLVTGGGAFNKYLVEKLSNYSNAAIVIPDEQTIAFKEALVFAFLGVLRINKVPNALKEVTGAKRSSVGGAIYSGK